MKHILTIFCFCVLSVSIISAQSGTLDKSFGDTGVVISVGDTAFAYASVLQTDGKIIVGGNGSSNNMSGYLAERYNNDGTLDVSYGNNGTVVTSFYNLPEAMELQSSGKLISASETGGNNSNIILVRYNTNGNVDSSFGTNGILTIDFTIYDEVLDMVIQPDDKIIIVGRTDNRVNDQATIIISRYLPDGYIDEKFGENGSESIVYQNQLIRNVSVALQQDGKIILGSANEGKNFFVERYLSNGGKDLSFGANGRSLYAFPNIQYSIVNSINVTPDGKILAGGTTQSSQDFLESMTLVCFDSSGVVDNEFGNKGSVITKFENGANSEITSILTQSDKKIIAAGRTYVDFGTNKYSYFALIRYNDDGALDSSFANNGIQTTSVGYFDNVSDAFLQNNGKIILTGSTNIGEGVGASHYVLARYNNDISKKQILITKIRHWLQHHNGFTWNANNNISSYVIQRSYDGIHFSSIARINANNNSNYTYEDPSPLSGNNYYRLQTTSINGTVNYSNAIAVTNNDIKISPNPAANRLHIEGLSNQKVQLSVVDFSGNIKLQTVVNSNTYNLNIASLKPGNYLLKIESLDDVITKSFVKQ